MVSKSALGLYNYTEKIILLLLILYATLIYKPGQNYINSDGQGYYAYLPAIFIYNDLEYTFYDDIANQYYSGNRHPFRVEVNGSIANKTWPGLALLWLPFFLLAHVITLLAGMPPDGYSSIYQFSILIASYFYLYWGLYFLKKLLKKYTENYFILFITILLVVFATPLFNYAGKMPSFTHAYSFSIISFLLYKIKRFSETHHKKHILPLSTAFALIILLRPTNGLVILSIPFICENWNNTKQFFIALFKNVKPLLAAFILFLSLISIIPILYKLQVDEWLIWQYRDRANYEAKVGFNFTDPNFFNFLFSYRNGLFIYSPLLFIALGGLIPIFKSNKFKGTALLTALITVIYALSSWHSWYYGMSFGMRAMVDYLPYFSILLIALFSIPFKFKKSILALLSIIIIAFTLIQNYQYRNGIFHWIMNKEKYWDVFLKTDNKYNWYLNRKYDSYVTPDSLTNFILTKEPLFTFKNSFEYYSKTNDSIAYSGKKSLKPNHWHTFLFNRNVPQLTNSPNEIILTAQIYCYPLEYDLIKNHFKIIIKTSEKEIVNITSESQNLKYNQWNKINFTVLIEDFKQDSDKLQILIQTLENKAFLFDHFSFKIYPN